MHTVACVVQEGFAPFEFGLACEAFGLDRTDDGIPYVIPEVVLLFKAKARRAKDEADFQHALPARGGGEELLHERQQRQRRFAGADGDRKSVV